MATSLSGSTRASAPVATARPLVAAVGGPLLHTRLDLLEGLRDEFAFVGIGASAEAQAAFQARGLDFRRIDIRRGIDILGDLAVLEQLYRIFRTLNPLIVHTYQGKLSAWGRLAAQQARVPIIVGTIEGLGSLFSSNAPLRRILRKGYERLQERACRVSDLTVFQNPDDLQELVDRGIVEARRAALIPGTGVRTDVFDPDLFPPSERSRIRQDLGLEENCIVVTTATRLLRTKGVFEFAKTAAAVREQDPSIQFLLVGALDEDSMDRITLAEMKGVEESVRWLGQRSDIPALLAASDIFVLASAYREGLPRSLLEAMSMALPVVTTDIQGCRYAVEDGKSGLVVSRGDVWAFEEAIKRLVHDERLRTDLGLGARARVVEHFSVTRIVEHTRQCYRRLLAERFANQ